MERDIYEKRKQMVYDLICDPLYRPMKIKEIAILLQVSKEARSELSQILMELTAEQKVEVSKRGKYAKAEKPLLTGVFTGNQKGFGFVSVEGEEQDIYIPGPYVHDALHQDVVQVQLRSGTKGKRREGEIVHVLTRGMQQIVGTYQKSENFGFVVPDNQKFGKDLFISSERSKGAISGHKVLVEVTGFGGNGKKPEGKVLEILGHVNDPGTDILSIVYGFELPTDFSPKVLNQAERIADTVSPADLEGRLDLREMPMVTIDGEDAKDLDDAVSLTVQDGIYHLGVHIADVTNYVQGGSALDKEALERGTSVYLVDRVIPMLPHRLSNGICSLNQGVDRLALSCMMDIDGKGNVIGHRVAETVIRVDERMTYTSVKQILEENDEKEIARYEALVPMFREMEQLAALLRAKRKKRGSIDFDFPETKVILDDSGRPVEIRPYDRNVATKLIEEFMLAANETVAQDFYWQEIPFVYRTHETPDQDKIQQLSMLIYNFGYTIHTGREQVHPKEIQKLLTSIEDTPQEALISRLTLRSMKQARYTVESTGHFGLAAEHYCHFTSPIRRYPDLQIHRIIKETLRGRMDQNRIEMYAQKLPSVAKQSSDLERRAEEAERETIKLKKVQYMEERIGRTYEGVISGVTAWGMYIELENTVEGMVHITRLTDDYYIFREETYELTGEKNQKSYKLGQKVRVRVAGADRMTRTIDFELEED